MPGAQARFRAIAGTWLGLIVLSLAALLASQEPQGGRPGRGPADRRAAVFNTAVPDHQADVILARPTADSMALSVLFYQDARASVAYGVLGGAPLRRTDPVTFKAGQPALIVLRNLDPGAEYAYELRRADIPERAAAPADVSGSFRTQRGPGSAFAFTVTADSHLDARTDPALYARTLRNAAADGPDFHVDLGDTFMTEQHADRQSAARQYLAQRYYFGLVAGSAPLFLALGNHDGEGGWRGTDGLGAWALDMRTRYFPNPVPDAFYSGNASRGPSGQPLEDYYAWRWGDALFIVLDPFWYSDRRGGGDGWGWTLGTAQYEWLARALERIDARFTFVFIHHLVGGADRQARGGAEASRFFEWGGANADGTPGFSSYRRGWGLPIHDLLAKHHVTAVFHGHDHLYARQERDGIAYQEVPQPGNREGGAARSAGEYGYRSGTVLGGTGYLRVRVAPNAASVEFIDMGRGGSASRVADRHVLPPRHSMP